MGGGGRGTGKFPSNAQSSPPPKKKQQQQPTTTTKFENFFMYIMCIVTIKKERTEVIISIFLSDKIFPLRTNTLYQPLLRHIPPGFLTVSITSDDMTELVSLLTTLLASHRKLLPLREDRELRIMSEPVFWSTMSSLTTVMLVYRVRV